MSSELDTDPLDLDIAYAPRVHYAMQQNAVPLVQRVALTNRGAAELRDVEITLTLEPEVSAPWSARIASIPPGGTYNLEQVDLVLRPESLAASTERQAGTLRANLRCAGHPSIERYYPLDVLAYNEWPGDGALPEILAAFVLPNHPSLAPILQSAARRLERATGRGDLDGYQSRDPERARAMAHAIYAALGELRITYVNPPASFEEHGQKIRTPEQITAERLGTCLDLAVFLAACLEQVGLRPLLVLVKGHAFPGVWLEAGEFPEVVVQDPLRLKKRVEIDQVELLECNGLCSVPVTPAARAREQAQMFLERPDDFRYALDVHGARRRRIRPLPLRSTGFVPLAPVAASPTLAAEPPAAPPTPPASVSPPAPAAPQDTGDRIDRWKRKLLDLSLRNRLLNFRPGKKTVPLLTPDLAQWEDALSSGRPFAVLPRPDWERDPRDLDLHRARTGEEARAVFLREELDDRRLHADLPLEELDRRLLEIHRAARTSLEESGANTLYLAVGFLQWFEAPSSTLPRLAPLLLLPLNVERVSASEGFRVSLADEEPHVNTTLLQKLESDYGIRVHGLDEMPEDAAGLDVPGILRCFRRAIVEVDRWQVLDQAWIGFFSFTKHLMWLDLEEGRDQLLRNAFLRHLVESPQEGYVQDGGFPVPEELDEREPDSVLCPKDADSSQMAAVLAAAAGRSFVLEGPPGTGKSQTITNLIAQCLAEGQRVLFVAEKRAALEVVQRRLQEVGLGPFCLEVHSNKGSKKEVVQQLGRALDMARAREPRQWSRTAAELQDVRVQLNRHVQAVHRRRPLGISVFDGIATLVVLRNAPRVPELEPEDGEDCSEQVVARKRELVGNLEAAAAQLGVPREHAFFGVRRPDWHPATGRELEQGARGLAAAATTLHDAARAAGESLAHDAGDCSRHGLRCLDEVAELLENPPPPALLTAADWPATKDELSTVCAAGAERDVARARVSERYRKDLLDLDLTDLRVRFLRHGRAFFLWRWLRLRPARARLRAVSVDGRIGKTAQVLADLEAAQRWSELEQRLQNADRARDLLGVRFSDAGVDWSALEGAIDGADRLRTLARELAADREGEAETALRHAWAAALQEERLPDAALARLRSGFADFETTRRAVAELLYLDEEAAYAPARRPGYLQAVQERMARWRDRPELLREYCDYHRAASAAIEGGLEPLVAAHRDGELATGSLRPAFERSFHEAWLEAVLEAEPELRQFRGVHHERLIERFRDLDRRWIELAAGVVRARLCARMPDARETSVETSETGILLRELKKQRRHLPVRQLFARIPNLIARLSPCLLTSPLSVAQYLGRRFPPADVVVFDEASQIPVWDAVGAIGRGRSLVVVGDSKQLPPTTFFQKLEGEDEPAFEEDFEELESVLDECGAAGLHRMYLRWHYRSRHEQLIAFSNHHYYANRLLTFPSPQAESPHLGVRWVPVDGVYDRGRSQTNRAEAEALVAEVLRRLQDPELSRHSLGIVTFSSAQQTLIEDLLDEKRREHPEIERFFAAENPEPVFVKNLENVQGDERDAILFSVCYGPDQAGKTYMHFGPLNRQGGERRLNVAVTRARRELVVFSSLHPEQIDLSRTGATGALHLRAFLDYARRGIAAIAEAVALDPGGDYESPFERAVGEALTARGHIVRKQVGCSGYRIDLAVVDPERPGRYLLGVECDGRSYHSAATARDRDRLRHAVLDGLGWRLHRVWSTDWWLDPRGELDRIEQALAAAGREPCVAIPPPAPRQADPRESDASPEPERFATGPAAATASASPRAEVDGPLPYPEVPPARELGKPEHFHDPRNEARLRSELRAILEREAPIAFSLAARRLARLWGIQRLTQRVRDRVSRVLQDSGARTTADGEVVWAPDQDPDGWDDFRTGGGREASELPLPEVANAAAWVLAQHVALSAEDLARETARQFGITRLGNHVRAVMAAGIERLVRQGRAVREQDRVRLP